MVFIRHPKRLGSKSEVSSIKRSRIGETDTTAHMKLKVHTPTQIIRLWYSCNSTTPPSIPFHNLAYNQIRYIKIKAKKGMSEALTASKEERS